MKQPTLITILILLAIACLASPVPEFPFVYVTGSATVKVPPNTATIEFRIKATDPSSTNALAVVAERSAEVLDFLAANKITPKDIIAYEVDKSTMREGERFSNGKIIGYEISRLISVTMHDVSRYDDIARHLLAMENVFFVDTGFGHTDRERLEAELTTKACADASANAERMAKGFGVELGSLYAISETKDGFTALWSVFGVAREYVSHHFESGPSPRETKLLFVPSSITLRKGVHALFRMKTVK